MAAWGLEHLEAYAAIRWKLPDVSGGSIRSAGLRLLGAGSRLHRGGTPSPLPLMGVQVAFLKLTLSSPGEGEDPEIYVNLDLAVSLKRSGDRTVIEFDAPQHAVMPMPISQDPRRRIDVVETPEEILERAPYRRPQVLP